LTNEPNGIVANIVASIGVSVARISKAKDNPLWRSVTGSAT
jgi:hypothetical protein